MIIDGVALLDRAIVRFLPAVPKPVVRKISERYIAGTELEDACRGQQGHDEDGIRYQEVGIDRVLFRSSARTELAVSGCRRDARFVDPRGQALSDHAAVGVEFRWRWLRSPAAQLVMSH